MQDIISFFTFRSVILLFSTTFSILFVMLMLNIITVDDLVAIFNLSSDAETALRLIIERIREISENILEILSQLLNKLFSWAGVDIDLSKIKIDVNNNSSKIDK